MPNVQDAKHETNDPSPSTSSNPVTITPSGSPANSLVYSPANQPTQPTKKFQHKNSTIKLQWHKK